MTRRHLPTFLTVDEVVELHEHAVDQHGGSHGIRDGGMLDAAVHAPQATYGGEFLYPDIFDMASVYLLHIAANHPFVDGNKRTAWFASRAFLAINGYRLKPRWKEAVRIVESVGSGDVRDWRTLSEWLARAVEKR